MINKETVQTLTEEWLKDNDYFLVDINFAADDRIVIEIDHADGVWIDDCAELSRFLQERLGRNLVIMNSRWVVPDWDSRSRWLSNM